MRNRFLSCIVLTAAFASAATSAQTADERKAAAQRWLARDNIKIDYVGANYSNRFSLDVKAKEITFYGSQDRFCAGQPVPAVLQITDEGMLAFIFDPKRNGCAQLRYTFDPITKAGYISIRENTSDPAAPWSKSKSKVTLVE